MRKNAPQNAVAKSKRPRAARSPLEAFVQREGLQVSKLARWADMSTPHVFEITSGRSDPKASTVERLRGAAERLLNREVTAREMFGFGA